jgi:hypothetical protein
MSRPAFLDALIHDATIAASGLRTTVSGKEAVIKIIEVTGSLYASMQPAFHGEVQNKEFLEYDAVLANGTSLHGVVVLTKTADGQISHVSVTQSPIDAVMWLSVEMGKILSEHLGDEIFL